MIHLNTVVPVSDNSGAKIVKCIKVLGSTGKKVAAVGDVIAVSIRKAEPRSKVAAGEVHYAIVIRTKSRIRRKDGSYLRFDDNAVVLISKNMEIKGTRVFGSVAAEVKQNGFTKIASLASEIL
jgi:large subunit ribosomal protein L14